MANLYNGNVWFLQQFGGKALSSVEFVQDYVQLRFDAITLTAYTWPQVTVGATTFSLGESRYKTALCAEIGVRVKDAKITEGEDLRIFFDDGATFIVSLRDHDYHGPEAVQIVSDDGWIWVA